MHLNSYNLQEEHPKGQYGSRELWQPPEAARPTEHGAGRDALVHTQASPKSEGGFVGLRSPQEGPAIPTNMLWGSRLAFPSTPAATASPSREGACACGCAHSGHEMLEHVGWGFLQAELYLRDSAPHHASDVSSLHYRDRQVQERSV